MFCTIAYDATLKRPGCVLLQAMLGASVTTEDLHKFPSGSWLLTPTPDLRVYPVRDKKMLRQLVGITKQHGRTT